MADNKPKELYWFKYEPKRYLTGKIQYCSLEAQGLFANIQCYYWQRECEMSYENLIRKFKAHETLIEELVKEDVIKIEKGMIYIDFLDEQYEPQRILKEKLSAGGREGARIANENRKRNKLLAEGKEQTLFPATDVIGAVVKHVAEASKGTITGTFFYIGKTMYKFPVSKYVLDNLEITINTFMPTMLPITTEEVLKQLDIESAGAQFNDEKSCS